MINLFAVPVAKSPIGRNYTDSELKYIESQLERPSKAIDNHASPNKNVLAHDELKDLQTIIQQHLDNYFKAVYNTSNNVALQITQSWLTLSRKGESHHSHTHPNSVVSGVLYVNVARNDGINFYRNEENLWFELEPSETNYYNSYKIHVATKVGDLVLFPSSVKHGVNKVTEDIKRVSLSFNTIFSGEMGNPELSNALRITTS